jgi:hypothetical protein
VSRITYRLLLGVIVLPFVISGWLWSVWLSELAVQAAENHTNILIQAEADD